MLAKQNNHTIGPWYNHGLDGLFDGRTHGPSIQDSKGNVICAVEAVDPDLHEDINKERLANANIIAAAPEMLSILQWVEQRIYEDKNPNTAYLLDPIRQIISKARSE